MCYGGSVSNTVSVRELRNTTSDVLRRVEAGERVILTVDRRPVAQIVPIRRPRSVPLAQARALAARHAADRGLLRDLAEALPDTTDDL